jgi:hypothetical protein
METFSGTAQTNAAMLDLPGSSIGTLIGERGAIVLSCYVCAVSETPRKGEEET